MNKKKINYNYTTQNRKEMYYLIDNGIPYIYVNTNENGVSTWEFRKDVNLFEKLQKFYYELHENYIK